MSSTATPEEAADGGAYDRLRELKAFDDTKAGVKGLVDAGITTVPAIFRHPHHHACTTDTITIPVIDLSAADAGADARAEVVSQVKAASETVGFFQLINHGIPINLLSNILTSVRRFHESPSESKLPYYTRDPRRRVRFNSNFDLLQSPAANWRDTLFFAAPAPDDYPPPPASGDLPAAVRDVIPEYAAEVRALAARVMALMSEALGLDAGKLEAMGCGEGISVVCNYYPPCPEPEVTMGCGAHSDPSFLTVLLLQDGAAAAGLQVRGGGGGEEWTDVAAPVAGALLVNVGDMMQLVSNGRFRSVEHRVVATAPSAAEARVSVACFCNADVGRDATRRFGPIPELITSVGDGGGGEGDAARAAVYRSVTVAEFLAHYDGKGLDGRPALDNFRLHQYSSSE
ncbi:unnamed protein product [Urochloa humidicola]